MSKITNIGGCRMRSLRNEKKRREKGKEEERKIDVKVSSRRETERRNQMTLKAAFNYEDT